MDSVSHIIRFQYLKEHRNSVRIDKDDDNDTETSGQLPIIQDLSIISTLMCEYMATTSQFVQFGYDYYKFVCGTNDDSSTVEEKSCLIPVCSFQPANNSINATRSNKQQQGDRNTLNFADYPYSLNRKKQKRKAIGHDNNAEKRQRLEGDRNHHSEAEQVDQDEGDEEEEEEEDDGRGQGLDSYCVKGVDDALQILSKAADCLRHTVELWNWASSKLSQKTLIDHLGGWEQGLSLVLFLKSGKKRDTDYTPIIELCRVIEGYRLPFDMHNAVLLVRSDLALSSVSALLSICCSSKCVTNALYKMKKSRLCLVI